MVYKKEEAFQTEKHGVKMLIYNGKKDCEEAAVVYQETDTGHGEEFFHEKSAFLFYIIEGSGTWYIEDVAYPVKEGNLVIVPKMKRFFYRGGLQQVCITAPAWEEEYERHVRMVEF